MNRLLGFISEPFESGFAHSKGNSKYSIKTRTHMKKKNTLPVLCV